MKILILGATGNVGQQALSVINKLKYQLVGISYFSNDVLAAKIIEKYDLANYYSPKIKSSPCKSFSDLIKKSKPDIIINAISGFAGLEATVASIKSGTTLANANKESFVVAGKFVNELSLVYQCKIIPIDSEHAAIHELIQKLGQPNKILITGSGGPFYKWDPAKLKTISPAEAIKHPKWNMGQKISIDSATHMNKCLEIIEAFWLFDCVNIEPLYHPEAMIHSMIEVNSKVYGIESPPSMTNPIKYALKNQNPNVQGNLVQVNQNSCNYTLEPFDQKAIPIHWAQEIINKNLQWKAIVLNAANEVAVEWFIQGKISFLEIYKAINFAFQNLKFKNPNFLFQVEKINKKTKKFLEKNYFKKIK